MTEFETDLEAGIFSKNSEKTFVDKLLSKDDVDKIRELIKKPRLSRSELLEITYLISGNEAKLLNYSDNDRYIILKFFVWINEFIKIIEILFDYEDELLRKQNTCKNCHKSIKLTAESYKQGLCTCIEKKPILILTKRTEKLLENNSLMIQHNAKFLIDLYLNISRSSMSVGGAAFIEFLRNRFEMPYPVESPYMQGEKKGFLGGLFGGGKKK